MTTRLTLLLGLLALAAFAAPTWASGHPLDPLSAAELEQVSSILAAEGHAAPRLRFAEIALLEPPKSEVLAWRPGQPVARAALVVALDRAANVSYEGGVDVARSRLASWRPIERGQPMMLMEEYEKAGDAVTRSEAWRAAMARRGIAPEDVYLDAWAPGEDGSGIEGREAAPRISRVLSFLRGDQKNPYGPPIEGVVALVDLNAFEVIDVIDAGVAPLSTESTDYFDPEVTGARPPLLPFQTSLPKGPGFTVDGQLIRWDRWSVRWSVTPREGLVLHQLGWDDAGQVRPMLHRASMSEMVVPYADPAPTWVWRSAFDEGEYGLGRLSVPLTRGVTAPPHATLLDAVLADDDGRPETLPGAVAVHERDGGLLWFHHDADHGSAARRARELVIQSIATIGNYDYCTQWVLHQDGAVTFELILSGSLLTKGVEAERCTTCGEGAKPSGDQRNGTLVASRVVAPHHQHFVNLRLDFDVDGPDNEVKELNVRADTASRNPRSNAFVSVPTRLRSERRAARRASPAQHRSWEIASLTAASAQGHPTALALLPGATSEPYPGTRSPLRRKGAFALTSFHATRHHDAEMFAAGRYPNQNEEPDGLVRWIADDEELRGDVVVWYTVGVTHVARPEEYPIMNATKVGFRIVPVGFFDRNPGLDVP